MSIILNIASILESEIPRFKNRIYAPASLVYLKAELLETPFITITNPSSRIISTQANSGEISNRNCFRLESEIHIDIFESISEDIMPVSQICKAREKNIADWEEYSKNPARNRPSVIWWASDNFNQYFIDILSALLTYLPSDTRLKNMNTMTNKVIDIGLQNSIAFTIEHSAARTNQLDFPVLKGYTIHTANACDPCTDFITTNKEKG